NFASRAHTRIEKFSKLLRLRSRAYDCNGLCSGAWRGAQGGGVLGFAYRCGGAEFLSFVLEGGADECGEERVRFERLGFEFWVELAAEEPWVVWGFDDFD